MHRAVVAQPGRASEARFAGEAEVPEQRAETRMSPVQTRPTALKCGCSLAWLGFEVANLVTRVQAKSLFFSDLGWRPNTGKVVGNFSLEKRKGLSTPQKKKRVVFGTNPGSRILFLYNASICQEANLTAFFVFQK
jgi:hypothetical protein